ncbi:hypothetical protein D3C73_1156590 [compost metagenome]
MTRAGKTIIRNMTRNSAIMNGTTPRMTSSSFILPTPATTLRTAPTGGVTRPIELLMMNITPKYTGSISAARTTGISTGVRIKMVGVMSMAVPTTMTSTMMAAISRILLSMNGCSISTMLAGSSATVISQALTMAAAIRNMTIALVFAAPTNTAYNWLSFSSR